jgi:hypothetical protein
MKQRETGGSLTFDYPTIRLVIGLITLFLPWVVWLRAGQITPSISWSYYTDARDSFVGMLCIVGAFLISYKGHQYELTDDQVEPFWHWVQQFWQGAIAFRIWEKHHEEDVVSWVGGIGALVTASVPTNLCFTYGCPSDPRAIYHYLGAAAVLATTVYFCLIAFMDRAREKLAAGDHAARQPLYANPIQLRVYCYAFCGWSIAALLISLVLLSLLQIDTPRNTTFWLEAVSLELFGMAWMVASQKIPGVASKAERAGVSSSTTLSQQ